MRIVYCQQSVVAEKDFVEEVRALLDVRKFVTESFILMDVQEIRIKYIVDTMVDRLAKCGRLAQAAATEAKRLLFVDRNSLSMVLANTMQGLYKSRLDGRLAYDHSWIVATASLSGQALTKRQVAIARLPQPVNFGRNSQEVRFLIVVLAPNKDKLTKSAWETGRTFATMFIDIGFRRRLLKAKSQEEFKRELLVRAEDLARDSQNLIMNSSEDLAAAFRDENPEFEYQICMRHDTLGGQQSQVQQLRDKACSELSLAGAALAPVEFLGAGNNNDNKRNSNNTKSKCKSGAGALHSELVSVLSPLSESHSQPERKSIAICAGSALDCWQPAGLQRHYSLSSVQQPQHKRPSVDSNSTFASDKRSSFDDATNPATDLGGTRGNKTRAPAKAPYRLEHSQTDMGHHNQHHKRHDRQHNRCLDCCHSSLFTQLGAGLLDDLSRRSKFYLSDFTDGFLGDRSLYKTISTTIFLYFSVLLPCIAFGVVDTNNTEGAIDPKKTMIGQALGGLFFAMFSGQPLVVVMTTAPLCIYVKVIYQVAQDLEVSFYSFYACVGLWMSFFLVLMALTNSSNLMKHCTRSTEDIFALFTAFAFGSDGVKEAVRSFQKYYWEPDCLAASQLSSSAAANSHPAAQQHGPMLLSHAAHLLGSALDLANQNLTHPAHNQSLAQQRAHPSTPPEPQASAHGPATSVHEYQQAPTHELPGQIVAGGGVGGVGGSSLGAQMSKCQRETCVLFLFLMCGTLWLANSFSSFNRTPYLSVRKREVIKDYALAISVLIFSFIGSFLFADIRLDVFEFSEFTGLHLAQVANLSWNVWTVACLLGFMASVLFYIDQNICSAMVNNAPYKLKKGNYFHLDLLVLAVLNTFLSLTGLPWMHGKLPHSHLHSKALADYEERVDEGHIHQIIVNIRETRLTGILTSMLIALSLLAVPYPLSYIPLPVLSGVFLYTALAEFKSNSMVERICLLFTEQAAYPPNHYIRRCPQRKIHLFTLAQIIQLAIVSLIGFYPNPYVNMAFPLAVATFVPVRRLLLPKLFERKYLRSLDSPSLE